jgi:opacity protein-like surface antigen
MKVFSTAAVIAVFYLAYGPAAAAQQEGWYGGLSMGKSAVHVSARDWDDGTLTNDQLEHNGVAYKIIAGYRFKPRLALELSYMQFGDSRFTAYQPGTSPSLWKPGQVFGRAKAKGVSLEGVLALPFKNRYAAFVKGGLFMWDTTMLSNPTLAGGTLALSDQQVLHDDGINLIYGAGAEMRFNHQWHARLEWQHTTVRFASIKDRGVDFPSLGVTLDF